MKTTMKIAITIAIAFFGTLSANAHEASKIIEKSCPLTSKNIIAELKYSNIRFEAWDKNEIYMRAEIKSKGPNQKISDAILKYIDVKLTSSSSNILIRSEIDHDAINKLSRKRSYSVNITIKMPAELYLDITNKYGNATISQDIATLNSDIKYGNLTANFVSGDVDIYSKYGNTRIRDIGGDLDIYQKYGNMNISSAKNVEMECKYGNATIDKAVKVMGYVGYGSLNMDQVGTINLSEIGYSRCKIDLVEREITVGTLKYGSISITLGEKIENARISSAYSNVNVGVQGSPYFDYNLTNSYGNIDLDFPTNNVRKMRSSGSSKTMEGTIGNGTTKATVSISNAYANTSIYQD